MRWFQLRGRFESRSGQDSPSARFPDIVNIQTFVHRRKIAQKRASEKGTAMIEFALVAILLFTAVFGMIEMDRMLLVYTTLANSTRAAVRYAVVHGSDRSGSDVNGPSSSSSNANVSSVVTNLASAGSLNSANLTVTVSYTACASGCATSNSPGSTVSVRAVYAYDPFTVLPLNVNLTSVSEGVVTF